MSSKKRILQLWAHQQTLTGQNLSQLYAEVRPLDFRTSSIRYSNSLDFNFASNHLT